MWNRFSSSSKNEQKSYFKYENEIEHTVLCILLLWQWTDTISTIVRQLMMAWRLRKFRSSPQSYRRDTFQTIQDWSHQHAFRCLATAHKRTTMEKCRYRAQPMVYLVNVINIRHRQIWIKLCSTIHILLSVENASSRQNRVNSFAHRMNAGPDGRTDGVFDETTNK